MNRKHSQKDPEKPIPVNSTDLGFLTGVDTLYVYPHHEIELVEGKLLQTRSGPNWEGGIVTLTTCKHLLRTYSSMGKRTAVCGVTNKLNGQNFVLYVGKLDEIFDSNAELSQWLKKTNPSAWRSKLMTTNRLGDICEIDNIPTSPPPWGRIGERRLTALNKYNHKNFVRPTRDHCRYEERDSSGKRKWVKDIEYKTRSGVRPKVFTLNPVTVFTEPILRWDGDSLARS